MNPITIQAFFDEIQKIKEAGMMRDIGDGALGLGKAVINNSRNTLIGFTTPIASMGKGLKASGGMLGKGLTGIGAAMGAPEAFSSSDPTGQGRSRVERTTTWMGDTAGGLIGAPHGLISGSIVGSVVGKAIGKVTGKTIDKARGYGAGPVGVNPPGMPNEAYGSITG